MDISLVMEFAYPSMKTVCSIKIMHAPVAEMDIFIKMENV